MELLIESLLDQLQARAASPPSLKEDYFFPQSPTSLTADQDYIITDGSQVGMMCRCLAERTHSEAELRCTVWRETNGLLVCEQCGYVLCQTLDSAPDLRYPTEGGGQPLQMDRHERYIKKPFVYTPAYHMRRYMQRMEELPRFWQRNYHVPLMRQYLDLYHHPRFISPAEIKIALKRYGLPHTFNQYAYAIADAVAMRPEDRPPRMPFTLQQALLTCHVILSCAFKALKETGALQGVVNMVNYYFAIHHILEDILEEPFWASLWPVTRSPRAQHMQLLFDETVKCAGGPKAVRQKAWATVNFLTPGELEKFFRESTLAWISSEPVLPPLHE